MMNQNKVFDFTKPNRQSPVAILLVVLKTTKTVFRQLVLPLIIFFIIGRKSNDYGQYFVYFILLFSILSMVYSIINFFKSYYYIQGKELIVHSGFISKKQLSIPFERIQNINFEQNIIHQIFGVKKMKIDTAGSADKELDFSAIENHKAEALRDLLINENNWRPSTIVDDTNQEDVKKETTTILQLSFIDLIKAGLFENHLKSGGLIFVAAWYLYANAQEVGLDAEDYIDKLPPIVYGVYLFISLTTIFIVASVLISLVKTTLKHFNLKFLRIDHGFKIEQGLFNTVTISALDHKIQSIAWSDSLLKKAIGIYDIRLKQAKAENKKDAGESIAIPGANIAQVQQVLSYLFPNENIEGIEMKSVHRSYRNRQLMFYSLLPLIAIIASIVFQEWTILILAILCLLIILVYTLLNYKKLAYGYNEELIRLKGGAFGEKNIVTFIYKLQGIKKLQSPFQRKNGLVSLQLQNASGSVTIPYINENEANTIVNVFLKKVETDKRNWL